MFAALSSWLYDCVSCWSGVDLRCLWFLRPGLGLRVLCSGCSLPGMGSVSGNQVRRNPLTPLRLPACC